MAARLSSSSQMWNLKSGVSRRSSVRMASQISSGCAGTGGGDPPQGPAGSHLTEEGPGGERAPAALGGASVQRPKSRRRTHPEAAPQNARKASRADPGPKRRGGRSLILYPGSPSNEAHLSAQEAQ